MDKMLSRSALEASRQFIEEVARPLEIARYSYGFQGGQRKSVLEALADYQNPDGGFGRALEPDLRANESSVLCTTVALQTLRTMLATSEDELVPRAINYLLDTLDRNEGHWRIIPESAAGSPHAPWWSQTDRENSLDEFSLNPTAEVLGYLYDYRELVPTDVIGLVADRVVGFLSDTGEIEMHSLLCCLRLLATSSLPDHVEEPLQQAVSTVIDSTVARTPADWVGYSLRPLQVVDGPEALFMTDLENAVADNLDFEIATQADDGSWVPSWSWGEQNPEAWQRAKLEWSGILTLEKLLTLRRFGRMEGSA